MNEKKVLTHLIRAGRDALNMENVLNSFGYKETPYFNLYGEIADAIYLMIGEEVDPFDQSVTHTVMHDPVTSDEAAAEHLAEMLDKASSAYLDIPQTTRKISEETAEKRGMTTDNMIKLILSEWAYKEIYANNVL